MKKMFATGALAASLVGGSIALSAVGPFGIASAQDDTSTEAPAEAPLDGGRRGALVDEALTNLVTDGTLTQAQADAVEAELQEVAEAHRGEHEERRAEAQQALADILGITVEELEAARENGQTIADLAGDDVDAVIDAIVAERIAQLDERLAAGDITQEQYDTIVGGVEERVTAFVNGEGPLGGRGGRPGMGMGPRGGAAPAGADGATTEG